MAKAKKKTRRKVGSKLVCPKTYRRKKVRSSKGRCYIVLKSGARRFVKKVKPKAGAKRRSSGSSCKYGKVKSGPRKGRCRKTPVRRKVVRRGSAAGRCKFGKVKSGPRKGRCRKAPARRR